MNEQIQIVLEQVTRLWRRRWLALWVALAVWLAGWGWVILLPDRYESFARLYVDTGNVLRPLLSGLAVDSDVAEQVDLMRRTLLARPNLEKVVAMADLGLETRTPEDHEHLLGRLRKEVRIRADQSNLFTISYESPSPQRAQAVVDALMTVFVENNLGAKRSDFENAQGFLNRQIEEYEEQLSLAERRLAEFKQEHIDLLAGGQTFQARIEAARAQKQKLEAELKDVQAQHDAMREAMRGVPEFYAGAAGSGPPTDTDVQIMELQHTLQELLSRYTEQHPDVVTARRRLDALLAGQMPASRGDAPAPTAPGSLPNPTYGQLQLEVIRLASLGQTTKARIARVDEDLAELERVRRSVPEIETGMMQLTRDYGVIKEKYEELLSRRESARLSENRETSGGKVSFRTIEAPLVPLMPSGPDRLLLFPAVLVAGCAAGVGAAFLRGLVDDTFMSVRQLRSHYTVPVVGALSLTLPDGGGRARHLEPAAFAGLLLVLAAGFAGLLAVEGALGWGLLMQDGPGPGLHRALAALGL